MELTSRFRLYLQLDVAVVTQIHGNEGVTNINYGTEVRMTDQFVADRDLQNLESPIDSVLGYYYYLLYLHYLRLSMWYNTDETKAAE